jgi:hypothetical protein
MRPLLDSSDIVMKRSNILIIFYIKIVIAYFFLQIPAGLGMRCRNSKMK